MDYGVCSGQITRVVKDRGFGFITGPDNQLYFFHMSAVDPKSNVKFEELSEGSKVIFISEAGEKGPRAKPRSLNLVGFKAGGV